jgi:hypothetical protein
MSYEPPPSIDPVRKILWLLVALAPAALIMVVARLNVTREDSDTFFRVVGFGLNPALAIFGCCMLLHKPGGNKAFTIVGGICLGAIFAFLNIVLGLFLGCAFGERHH